MDTVQCCKGFKHPKFTGQTLDLHIRALGSLAELEIQREVWNGGVEKRKNKSKENHP